MKAPLIVSHPLELGPFTQLNEKKEPNSLAGPLEPSEMKSGSGATSQSVPMFDLKSVSTSVPSLISGITLIPADLGPSSSHVEKVDLQDNTGILMRDLDCPGSHPIKSENVSSKLLA